MFLSGPYSNVYVRSVERVDPAQPCDKGRVATIFTFTRMILLGTFFVGVVTDLCLSAYVSSQSGISTFFFRFVSVNLGIEGIFLVSYRVFMIFRVVSVRMCRVS